MNIIRILILAIATLCAVGTFSNAQEVATEVATELASDAVQGEYLGQIVAGGTKTKVGVRILALGDDHFRSIAYIGGLPGDGWTGNRKYESEAKRAEDGSITFESSRSTIRCRDGFIDVMMRGQDYVFKRFERRSPTLGKRAPKNAIVLLNAESTETFERSLENWIGAKTDGLLLAPGAKTKQNFGSHRIHVEFRVPLEPEKRGQDRGNSGVLVQGRYEIQILDSFALPGKHNECGGVLGIKRPDANVSLAPLAWQTLDIDFTAAKFAADGEQVIPPLMTVRHNGITVHKDVELTTLSPASLSSASPEPGPLYLEDRGSDVRFRNIWIVKTDGENAEEQVPVAAGSETASTSNETTNPIPTARLNQIQVIGTHNSYHIAASPPVMESIGKRSKQLAISLDYTHRPLAEQFSELGIRQIELDIFADPKGGLYKSPAAAKTIDGAAPLVDPDGVMERHGFKILHVQDIDYRTTELTLVSALRTISDVVEGSSAKLPDHGDAGTEAVFDRRRVHATTQVRTAGF